MHCLPLFVDADVGEEGVGKAVSQSLNCLTKSTVLDFKVKVCLVIISVGISLPRIAGDEEGVAFVIRVVF